ncbi:MAG: tetratricopeptide repeat protein, partial [Methylacidiphilales bacterium]|nr:tetratricopeptide repeat protein [Candidatus Methylacidiphilales bacterium]
MAKRSTTQTGSSRVLSFFKAVSFFCSSRLLQALVIVAVVAWIYGPVRHGSWLWDDDVDITHNEITQSANGLWSIWFKPGTQLDYYPLKASVQWAQWHLWGDDTFGYHVTNIVLHLTASLLVWRLFHKLGLRLAWLGGLLFAIHPAQVESVAWIAELKNTLSMPLFLLSMCFYLDYDGNGSRRDYLLALGFFLLAMLSKTTLVMFPVVILLYAWWKRGRFGWNDLKASAPFFLVSLTLGWVTLRCGIWYTQLHHVVYLKPELDGVLPRLAQISSSLTFYFWKAVWPTHLLPIYSQWKIDPPSLPELLPLPVLVGLLFWFWQHRAGWGRHVLLGFGYFLIMLAPFVSARIVGYMDFTWVMDHFLYVPIEGLIGLAVAGLETGDRRVPPGLRFAGWAVVMVILALLTGQSRGYAKKFFSQQRLWTYTLRHNPDAWPAHNNLGNVFYEKGQLGQALLEYEAVARLKPSYVSARCSIGHIRQILGDLNGALDAYNQAIALAPDNAEAYYSRATVRQAKGDWVGSLADLLMVGTVAPHSMYADYSHLLIWRVRLAQNQLAQAGPELAAALAQGWNAPPDEWVSKVARFLLGQMDEPAFFASAASQLAEEEREQSCEAWYFAGLKRLASGEHAAATADFQKCLATNLKTSTEYLLAQAELKAPG